MAHWIIVSKATGQQLGKTIYETEAAGRSYLTRMGPVLAEMYRLEFQHPDKKIKKMINEGLVRDDLAGILLPKVSIDVYVPADPNSDNVVIAFFLKGVPEAVIPFKNFIEKCNGVLQVDYGDSETVSDCSMVYVEMDRESLKLRNIHDMVIQIGLLCGLKPDDFSLSFPNAKKNFPYSPQIMKRYFDSRSRRANALAQKQALVAKTRELQDDIRDEIKKAKEEGDQMQQQNGAPAEEPAPTTAPAAPPPKAPKAQPAPQGNDIAGQAEKVAKLGA